MKIVLGLVGEKLGGKSTFVKNIQALLPKKKFAYVRFSDVLNDTLKLFGIENTRENLIKLAVAMRDNFSKNAITSPTCNRVLNANADIILLDGIRWLPDVQALRSLSRNMLIYITASAENRFNRLKSRKEKAKENQTTWEQFLQEEQAETEKLIPQIGKTADVTIENNGSPEELKAKIREFCLSCISLQ